MRYRFLSQYIRSVVCQKAKEQNLQTTKYFTPGTFEWDINQQKNIFKIIPADKIGVKLTESCMILPMKSLSWIVGIGKGVIISSEERDACKICKAKNCQYRKTF